MYKKNSILDRRVRPPSARNVENGPIEYEQQRKRELVRLDKYRRYEELKGWSSRNQWEDPQVSRLADRRAGQPTIVVSSSFPRETSMVWSPLGSGRDASRFLPIGRSSSAVPDARSSIFAPSSSPPHPSPDRPRGAALERDVVREDPPVTDGGDRARPGDGAARGR